MYDEKKLNMSRRKNSRGRGRGKGRKEKKVFPQVVGKVQMTREGFAFIIVEGDEDDVFVKAYREIDNDLARDNIENDIPAADLEDLLPKVRGGDWDGK